MYTILVTTFIITYGSAGGNAISTTTIGSYDSAATCNSIAKALSYKQGSFTAQARCVQEK